MLISLDVMKLLCNLIAHEESLFIKEQALDIAIACLFCGNCSSQQQVNEYIQADEKNKFMNSLKDMLDEYFEKMS